MTDHAIRALRLERQSLIKPAASEKEYAALFRRMQPVKAIAFSCPGEPPCLCYRCEMGDRRFTERWRGSRTIVKGRFQGGSIGYIFADDWEQMIAAYRKPADLKNPKLRYLYELLQREAPMTPRQIKECSGFLIKELMPLLHKLQQAFLVYEDQTDCDWERGWYLFESEFPDVDFDRIPHEKAVETRMLNALDCNVFCGIPGFRSLLGFPVRELTAATAKLQAEGNLVPCVFDGQSGWVAAEDAALLPRYEQAEIPKQVLVMHLSDPLVKANEAKLTKQYAGFSVLHYLLIDGEFQGAVTGKWKQGPHELWDIIVSLPEQEAVSRKEEIEQAVRDVYPHLDSTECTYNGQKR